MRKLYDVSLTVLMCLVHAIVVTMYDQLVIEIIHDFEF